MQTFIPLPTFSASARVLDRQRLGKQRVEVMQLLKALTVGGGWSNHPACSMWRGHEAALINYGIAVCDEWISRGYKDTCRGKIGIFRLKYGTEAVLPSWWGRPDVHSSHRSNLLRKDPEFYGQYNWLDSPEAPYVWPSDLPI